MKKRKNKKHKQMSGTITATTAFHYKVLQPDNERKCQATAQLN